MQKYMKIFFVLFGIINAAWSFGTSFQVAPTKGTTGRSGQINVRSYSQDEMGLLFRANDLRAAIAGLNELSNAGKVSFYLPEFREWVNSDKLIHDEELPGLFDTLEYRIS